MKPEQPIDRSPVSPADGGAPGDRRPAQAVRVTYTTAWLRFLAVVFLVVAWWYPLNLAANKWIWPMAQYKGVRDANSFVAIAYGGISSKTNEVSPELFKEQLETLRAHGYTPIRLSDVVDLMHNGKRLPRKAVLVTFDHGRKTSYFSVNGILNRMGWNAVMFLWGRSIEEKDPATVLWPYVKRMVRSRIWELGAQSYNGFQRIPADAAGHVGHFMTTMQWLPDESRYEQGKEFRMRLEADHDRICQLMSERAGIEPLAYAYPYGDFGQYQPQAGATRSLNMNLVHSRYKLGFSTGNLALNTQFNDSRRLNRLRVRSDWSGEMLLSYLDRSWPKEEPAPEGGEPVVFNSWILDWGNMGQEREHMVMSTGAETTGARSWLAGSDLSRDVYTRIGFMGLKGQLGVYLRASPDEESFVYIGIDSGGSIWLRQKDAGKEVSVVNQEDADEMGVWLRQKATGQERFTLAVARAQIDQKTSHILEVHLRGSIIHAVLDGRPVFRDRITLRGNPKPGMMGLSVWHPEKGRARVEIVDVALSVQRPTIASWNLTANMEPYGMSWIHQNAFRLTEISPLWSIGGVFGDRQTEVVNSSLFHMVSRMYRLNYVPHIIVNDEKALARISPAQLAEQAVENQMDGVLVSMAGMRNPTASIVAVWVQQSAEELKAKGLSMWLELPESMANETSIRFLRAIVPELHLARLAGSKGLVAAEKEKLAVALIQPVPIPAKDAEMPFSYEVPEAGTTPAGESVSDRIIRLQREGQAEFTEGRYASAMALWEEWLALEPGNPRASMLVGDACQRQGDLEQAEAHYARSLGSDPGQIALAMRRTSLLRKMGRGPEAAASLDLYARLFPDDEQILLAQAEWLWRENRGSEAIPRVKRILELTPGNLEARALLLQLPIPEEEFAIHLDQLLAFGSSPDRQYELGQLIWTRDLLSLPNTDALSQWIDTLAEQSQEDRVVELLNRLTPRTAPVEETFEDGKLSKAWMINNGEFLPQAGEGGALRSDPQHTEASLRLLGSEQLRDAFVAASIADVAGGVWLYLRRTDDHFIRFGFDGGGLLHLQIWNHGQIVASQHKPWILKEGQTRLRLEIHGGGAMGHVDGEPAFTIPAGIPSGYGLGWAGIGTFHAERGQAQVAITRLSAGPVLPRMVMLPPLQRDADAEAVLAQLREESMAITDLAPRWYQVDSNGQWTDQRGSERNTLGLFARYFRLHLLPVVEVASPTALTASRLVAEATERNHEGFVLLFKKMPEPAWMDKIRKELVRSGLDVLAVTMDTAAGSGKMAGLGKGRAISMARKDGAAFQIVPWTDPAGVHRLLAALPGDVALVLTLDAKAPRPDDNGRRSGDGLAGENP